MVCFSDVIVHLGALAACNKYNYVPHAATTRAKVNEAALMWCPCSDML